MPHRPEHERFELLDRHRVKESLGQIRNESRSLDGLIKHAREERGLSLQEDKVFGLREQFRPENPVKPPESEPGNQDRVIADLSGREARRFLELPDRGEEREAIEELDFTLMVQDLAGEENQGAIVSTSLSTGKQTFDYNFMLEAPTQSPFQAQEFTWDQGEVVAAQSWWSRFTKCVPGCCNWWTLFQCRGGSWSEYFSCIAARCGGCAAKCAACASCNCKWWCKWGAGCCSD